MLTRSVTSPSGTAAALPSTTRVVVPVAALCGVCAALGFTIAHRPLAAGLSVAILLCAVLFILAGSTGLALLTVALLPWLVGLIAVTPTLTLTLTSAAGVLLLLSLASPLSTSGALPQVGVALFVLILIAAVIESTAGGSAIEAAKYSLFPAMALVVSSRTGRQQLVKMRTLLLYSGVAVMGAQAATIALHIGETGTYYGAGEQIGLSSEGPHELALIGVMVSVACLSSVRNIRWRYIGAAIAATPAIATGVRSALVALVISLVVLAIRAKFRPSVLLGIAAISAAVIFTGTGTIVVRRYEQDQTKGEYSTFATAGSGRGAIWTVALGRWRSSGPGGIVFGKGLRSIEQIEQQGLGEAVTAQSDVVAVLVELGILGMVGWLLLWLAIIRSGISWIVLLPLATYAILSGSLEYVGAIVYGIALAGSLTPANHLYASSKGLP